MNGEEQIQKMLAQKAIRDGMRQAQQEASGTAMANHGATEGEGNGGLSGMCGRIEAFLAQAASAPAPQCIEGNSAATSRKRDNKMTAAADDREIHLNLILGVFEEKKQAMAAAANRGQGKTAATKLGANNNVLLGGGDDVARSSTGRNILLPSQQAEDLLYAEKMRDSQALLSMFGALADSRSEAGHSGAGNRKAGGGRQLGVKGQRRREERGDDDANDDPDRNENVQRCAEATGEEEENDDVRGEHSASSSDDEVAIMDYDDCSSSDDEGAADRARALLFGQRKPLIEEM